MGGFLKNSIGLLVVPTRVRVIVEKLLEIRSVVICRLGDPYLRMLGISDKMLVDWAKFFSMEKNPSFQ